MSWIHEGVCQLLSRSYFDNKLTMSVWQTFLLYFIVCTVHVHATHSDSHSDSHSHSVPDDAHQLHADLNFHRIVFTTCIGIILLLVFSTFFKKTVLSTSPVECVKPSSAPSLQSHQGLTRQGLHLPYVHISALFYYPLKSGAPIAASALEFNRLGFQYDRQWMLIFKESHRRVSAREFPKMLLIQPQLDTEAQTISFSFPNKKEKLTIPMYLSNQQPIIDALIGPTTIQVRQYTDAHIAQWFESVLASKQSFLLVTLLGVEGPHSHERPLHPGWDVKGQRDKRIQTAFTDTMPFLLTSTASNEHVNQLVHARKPVHMLTWRPNIVVSGPPQLLTAWEEDYWKRIEINKYTFTCSLPCPRCALPNIDPFTGERNKDGEPHETLKSIRNVVQEEPEVKDKVFFGMSLIQEQTHGALCIGDRIQILEKKDKIWNICPIFMEEMTKKMNQNAQNDASPSLSASASPSASPSVSASTSSSSSSTSTSLHEIPGFKQGTLSSKKDVPVIDEAFHELCRVGDSMVEEILSGQVDQVNTFTQDHSEFVVVLEGKALLELEGHSIHLKANDWVQLPPFLPHKVIQVEPGTRWLAVHGPPVSNSN